MSHTLTLLLMNHNEKKHLFFGLKSLTLFPLAKRQWKRRCMRGKTRQVGDKSFMRKLLNPFPKNQVLPSKNDVVEYLRGINVVSCGGARRKWTKFVSRKLHQLFFSCTLTLKVHRDKNIFIQSSRALFAQSMFDCAFFVHFV